MFLGVGGAPGRIDVTGQANLADGGELCHVTSEDNVEPSKTQNTASCSDQTNVNGLEEFAANHRDFINEYVMNTFPHKFQFVGRRTIVLRVGHQIQSGMEGGTRNIVGCNAHE